MRSFSGLRVCIMMCLLLWPLSGTATPACSQELLQIPSVNEITATGSANFVPQASIPLLINRSGSAYYTGPMMSEYAPASVSESSEEYKGDKEIIWDISTGSIFGKYWFEPTEKFVYQLLTSVAETNEEEVGWRGWLAEKFTLSMEFALTGEVPYLERLLHLFNIVSTPGTIIISGMLSPAQIAPDQFDINPPYAGMQYGSGGQDIPIEQLEPVASCPPGAPGCDLPGPPNLCQPGDPDCQIPGPPAPVCDEDCQCDKDPDCALSRRLRVR
jgi:hypothetical protein